MRNNQWLKDQLNYLLKRHFSDVSLATPLKIKFGREAKYRFGSIKLYPTRRLRGLRRFVGSRAIPQKSIITITSIFAKESVPAEVVGYTIAHELCHYAHGFSSGNRQLFKYPHHGGIVNKELARRGAGELIDAFKRWLKQYRKKILAGRIVV